MYTDTSDKSDCMNPSIMAYQKNMLACGAYCAEQMEVKVQTGPALQRTLLGRKRINIDEPLPSER